MGTWMLMVTEFFNLQSRTQGHWSDLSFPWVEKIHQLMPYGNPSISINMRVNSRIFYIKLHIIFDIHVATKLLILMQNPLFLDNTGQ